MAHCLAAVVPIETWSSWLAEVGIESTDAGCASTLFSLTSEAAVYCEIISPECRPPCRARKAGNPLTAGSSMCSTRRSAMFASSAIAILA